MDANWIVAHGIPAVTIGAGQRQVHTADEWIDLADFDKACALVVALALRWSLVAMGRLCNVNRIFHFLRL